MFHNTWINNRCMGFPVTFIPSVSYKNNSGSNAKLDFFSLLLPQKVNGLSSSTPLLRTALCFYELLWNITITDKMRNILIKPYLLTWGKKKSKTKQTGNQSWHMHAAPVKLANQTSLWNQWESSWTPNGLDKEILNCFVTVSSFSVKWAWEPIRKLKIWVFWKTKG